MKACPDCGSAHMGEPCGMTFAERIRTVRLSPAATPSSRKNYYDAEGVRDAFGENTRERMMEDTHGLGYARTDRTGTVYHRGRHGDVERVDPRDVDRIYLGGDTEVDA